MGQLDPRFGPTTQNRTVTVEYLDELYDLADELRLLKRYLEAMEIDIGGFDAWRSLHSTRSTSMTLSAADYTHGSARSDHETAPAPATNSRPRAHAAIY